MEHPIENYITNRRIGAKLHKLFTAAIEKRGLCAFDDKRYMLEDGINTLAFGHFKISTVVVDVQATEADRDVILAFRESLNEHYFIDDANNGPGVFPAGVNPGDAFAATRDTFCGYNDADLPTLCSMFYDDI